MTPEQHEQAFIEGFVFHKALLEVSQLPNHFEHVDTEKLIEDTAKYVKRQDFSVAINLAKECFKRREE